MRKRIDDEEERPRWIWRFLRGVLVSVLVSAAAVAVLSIFVLAPPVPPPPPQEPVDTGPEIVSGIEVSTTPAYTNPSATDAAEPEPETLGLVELSGPALLVNAAAFEVEPETPLVAVILDDTAANPLLHGLLFAIDTPLTVGVVAGGGGDRETAAAARAAGLEVVAQLPLVRQGQSGGGELEYGLSEADAAERTLTLMQRLPMAVAAARPLAAAAPPNAPVLRGMAATLAPLGFAYVDHGVEPGERSILVARELAIPVGVSRFTIPAGATAAQAIAVLDRAATDESGGAVVFAALGEPLLLALQLWGGEGSARPARLAPLSAVIRRQRGG